MKEPYGKLILGSQIFLVGKLLLKTLQERKEPSQNDQSLDRLVTAEIRLETLRKTVNGFRGSISLSLLNRALVGNSLR